MTEADRDYFARRADEERAAAARAACALAAQAHELLAERYAELAAAIVPGELRIVAPLQMA